MGRLTDSVYLLGYKKGYEECLEDLKNLPKLTMMGTRTTIDIPDFFDLLVKWEGIIKK